MAKFSTVNKQGGYTYRVPSQAPLLESLSQENYFLLFPYEIQVCNIKTFRASVLRHITY